MRGRRRGADGELVRHHVGATSAELLSRHMRRAHARWWYLRAGHLKGGVLGHRNGRGPERWLRLEAGDELRQRVRRREFGMLLRELY